MDATTVPCASPVDASTGAHTFSVISTDSVGNVSTTAPSSFTVDDVPPTIVVTAPSGIVGTSSPAIAFTTDDNGSPVASTTCSLDALPARFPCATSDTLGPLLSGPHILHVYGSDALGNEGSGISAFNVNVDAPVVTIGSPVDNAITASAAMTVNYSVDRASTDQCRLERADTSVVSAYAPCSGSVTYSSLAAGSYVARVKATATSNGIDGFSSVHFTVDLTDPAVSISQPSGLHDGAAITPAFTVIEANPGSTVCKLDTVVVGCAAAIDAPTGAHVFSVTHTDLASRTITATSNFEVDDVVPAVTITQPSGLHNGDPIATSFTATDLHLSSTVCKVDTTTVPCASPVDAANGTHTFSVIATDSVGNVSTTAP
ncbi:MAG: hypothetical protein JHC87_07430, partial [Thermoleophilaceae bacterium]|nr:hypothetical protein [Thermoleophilaceae bacterium]